jgi:hypothetical protein
VVDTVTLTLVWRPFVSLTTIDVVPGPTGVTVKVFAVWPAATVATFVLPLDALNDPV